MSMRNKYVLTVLAGWVVPVGLIMWDGNAMAMGIAAVTIAWWHGYMAARFEATALKEKAEMATDIPMAARN
jgi:hypothetical protein